MQIKRVIIFFQIILLGCLPLSSYADDNTQPVTGFGAVAINILGPVTVFSDFINTACIIMGVSFLFASVVKFFEHRRSPLMTPISTVVFLLIAGIALLLLPLMSSLTSSGIPYTLLNQ